MPLAVDRRGSNWFDKAMSLLFFPIAVGYTVWGISSARSLLEGIAVVIAVVLALLVHLYAYRYDENFFEASLRKWKKRRDRKRYSGK